uniref:Uncharacterized protein n=1 Tax=Ignisphaera aggregans TaxID=334771 RepID=A0A7C5UW06_9CREN
MISLAISSSIVVAESPYIPGRSIKHISLPLYVVFPTLMLTVVPGKLAIWEISPVILVNSVDFPTFGCARIDTTMSHF